VNNVNVHLRAFRTLSILLVQDENKYGWKTSLLRTYRGADESLAQPTSRCILFYGENISFDTSLVLYIYIYIYI